MMKLRSLAHVGSPRQSVTTDGVDTLVHERGFAFTANGNSRFGPSIYDSSKILVLDEATSSLDLHSEAQIDCFDGRRRRDRRLITHRLATAKVIERAVDDRLLNLVSRRTRRTGRPLCGNVRDHLRPESDKDSW